MRVRIGDRGQAATVLRPSGEVVVGGRRWPARCADGWADAGAEVVVTAADAFGLVVRPAASVSPAGLSNAGEVVPSAGELVERREARERQVWAEEAAKALRDYRVFALYLVLVAIPAAVAGHWLGGELGLKIALGVVIGVPLLLWAWASS